MCCKSTLTTPSHQRFLYSDWWQRVTAHTARRSFATNQYKRDFPTLMIMRITGHQTEKEFLTYIKVTEDENAERMIKRFEEQEKRRNDNNNQ